MEIQINENPLSQPMNGQFGKSTTTTLIQNTGNELHTVSDPPPSNQMALVNPEQGSTASGHQTTVLIRQYSWKIKVRDLSSKGPFAVGKIF